MSNFTSALRVLGTEWHITLCFCKAKRLGKFQTSNEKDKVKVSHVVYWINSDVTVLIFEDKPDSIIDRRHKYYGELGYGYDYPFVPHATVGKGNQVESFKHLIGETFEIGDEYARTF